MSLLCYPPPCDFVTGNGIIHRAHKAIQGPPKTFVLQ